VNTEQLAEIEARAARATSGDVPALCAALREYMDMVACMRRDSDAYHRGRADALREAANALRRMNFSRTAADVIESLAREEGQGG
jgi:hypothetical protein